MHKFELILFALLTLLIRYLRLIKLTPLSSLSLFQVSLGRSAIAVSVISAGIAAPCRDAIFALEPTRRSCRARDSAATPK